MHHESLGYAEDVVMPIVREKIWHLFDHPVTNPKKPEEPRVVFSCVAKFQEISPNDWLRQEPNWTTPLIEVLYRFRVGNVVISAEINFPASESTGRK